MKPNEQKHNKGFSLESSQQCESMTSFTVIYVSAVKKAAVQPTQAQLPP